MLMNVMWIALAYLGVVLGVLGVMDLLDLGEELWERELPGVPRWLATWGRRGGEAEVLIFPVGGREGLCAVPDAKAVWWADDEAEPLIRERPVQVEAALVWPVRMGYLEDVAPTVAKLAIAA